MIPVDLILFIQIPISRILTPLSIEYLNVFVPMATQEKALEVEGELHKIMLETVQETRLEGKHNLQVAVQRTEERCLQELLQAVAKAREEERKMAADKAAEVAQ